MSRIDPAALHQLRLERDLSLRQLAEKADISHTFIADIEKGLRQGSKETIVKLAVALEVHVSALSMSDEEAVS